MARPRGLLGEQVRHIQPDGRGISIHDKSPDLESHLLYDMFPVKIFGLFRTIQCSLDFCLDLLSQGSHEFDVDVRFKECSGDLFERSI
jgi:hypothetical protein